METKMSERVEREFAKLKDIYNVSYKQEFEIKALLQLQEEYDNIETSPHTTMTRKTLMDMIQRLQHSLDLREKLHGKMYVECNANSKLVQIYVDGCMTEIQLGDSDAITVNTGVYKQCTYATCSELIRKMALKQRATIYVDKYTNTLGERMYDYLNRYDDIRVLSLSYEKYKNIIDGTEDF